MNDSMQATSFGWADTYRLVEIKNERAKRATVSAASLRGVRSNYGTVVDVVAASGVAVAFLLLMNEYSVLDSSGTGPCWIPHISLRGK